MTQKAYKTYPGVTPSIQINKLKKLPRDRYILALKRVKQLIEEGVPYHYFDEPECSWGLCSEDKRAWPDAQDHIFPVDFETRGRMSMLDHDRCPLDTRVAASDKKDGNLNGCYHSCACRAKGFVPDKGLIVLRYDLRIRQYENAKG